jgi:hypothetical protein
MIKKFQDIEVGTTFKFNNGEYIKIVDEKVSCCRVNNAVDATNPATKISVPKQSEVEIND